MSDGCYAESIVKRKMTGKAILALVGLILAATAALVFTLVSRWGVLALVAVAIVIFISYKFLRVEYEAIFVTGELQIDKIYSESVRKKGPRVDMSDIQSVEEMNEAQLENAKRDAKIVIEDYTSHQKDAGQAYTVIYNQKGAQHYLLFEPTEKMLRTMWRTAPSKVHAPREILQRKEEETT